MIKFWRKMKMLKEVVGELFENRQRLFRLALYENKAQSSGTLLGNMWDFLNPTLQILVYWFVFSVGLKVLPDRGGYNYTVWMITGILPWLTINKAITSGALSIHKSAGIIKNVKMPLSLIPAKSVVGALISHGYMLIVLAIVLILNKVQVSFYFIQIIYYMICAVYFLIGFSLLTSAINAVFKDFQNILSPCIRLIFYISSVVWPLDTLSEEIQWILHINPLLYIIEGYRNSLLYQTGFWSVWEYTVMFWFISTVIFILGCYMHTKLRERFIDLI